MIAFSRKFDIRRSPISPDMMQTLININNHYRRTSDSRTRTQHTADRAILALEDQINARRVK